MDVQQAVIWDIGGTIVDRMVREDLFVQQAFVDTGLRPVNLSPEAFTRIQHEAKRGEKAWRSLAEEEAGFVGLARQLLGDDAPPGDIRRLGLRLANYYDTYAPVPGIRDLLDYLAARGIPQAAVTEWPPSLRRFLHHHDLSRYFSVVVVTAEEGILKPHTGLIRRAVAGLGLEPDRTIYIGDNLVKDIEPARQLGLRTLHFNPRRNCESADAYDAAGLRAALNRLLSG